MNDLAFGQTRGNLVTRIQGHVPNGKPNQESDVAKHLVHNNNHKINFDSPEILGHSNNNRQPQIKETLLMVSKNLTTNEPRWSIATNLFV